MKRIQFLKQNFLAGLLVVIPLGVITWIAWVVLRALWRVHQLLPEGLKPEFMMDESWVSYASNAVLTLGLTALLAVGISVLGWASKQLLGKEILKIIARMIQRIPVIRSVYSALDQLLRTLAAGGGQQFNRVVYVEYPRKGMWTLAFVTGPALGLPGKHLNIYVPTTPNPTSGFFLIVAEDEVRESNMKVEDAFKTILSLGIAQPTDASQ